MIRMYDYIFITIALHILVTFSSVIITDSFWSTSYLQIKKTIGN